MNRVFKDLYRAQYHRWKKTHYDCHDKSGNLKRPGRQDFINMVSEAWRLTDEEYVVKSFIKAEIIDPDYPIQAGEELDTVVNNENSFVEISFFAESSFVDLNSDEM